MKYYFVIEGKIYYLTSSKYQKFINLFDGIYPEMNPENESFQEALNWIEQNGKYIDIADVYNY